MSLNKAFILLVLFSMLIANSVSASAPDSLLDDLNSPDHNKRLEAIKRVGLYKTDSRVIPALIKIAKNDKLDFTETVAESDPKAKPQPTTKLTDKEVEDIINKAKMSCAGGRIPAGLKGLKLQAAQYRTLQKQLTSANDIQRTMAIDELAESKDPRAVNALISFLQKNGGNLRMKDSAEKALKVLGDIGDPKAYDILYLAANTARTPSVQSAAIMALGKLGDQKAVKYLSAASGQPFIGNDAVEALASLGGYDAVKALASITSSGKFPADRKAQEVMQSLGDDRGLEPLKELAENSDDINVRTKARSAIDAITKLEKKDDRHSISDIRSRARSRHKADSQNSATSMLEPGTIEPPLGDVAAKVRLSAINALSETKDDLAAAALIEIMKNNKEKTVIRNAAGKSLAANFNVRSLVNEYKTDLAKDSDNDIETIVSSAKCLGYLGTDEAVKKLIEIDEDAFALRNLTFELRSAPGDMRNKKDLLIIGSLGVSGNKKALTHLANSRVNFTNIDVICDALNQFNDPSCLKDLAKNSVNDPKAYTQKLDLIRNLGSLKYASDIAVMLKGRAVRKDIVNILDDWKWQPTTTEDKCFYYLAKQQHDKCKSLGTAGFQVYLTAFRHGMETEIADILIDTHGTEVKQILLDNLRSYFDGRLGTRFNKTHLTFLNEKFNWHPTSPDDKLYVALSTDKNALKELCRKDPKVGRLLKDKLLDSDMNVSYSLASMLIKIAADDMIPAMISRLDKEKNNVKRKNGWHKVRPYFELLINSGNEQLTNGAKNWAENNGIKINYIDMPTAQTSMWGQ